jgi:hypothetical protein
LLSGQDRLAGVADGDGLVEVGVTELDDGEELEVELGDGVTVETTVIVATGDELEDAIGDELDEGVTVDVRT